MIDHLLVGMHPLVPQKKRPQMNGPLILVGVGGIQYQEEGITSMCIWISNIWMYLS